MKLLDALARIERLAYIPFKDYLSPEQVQDAMMIINKGKTGQLLELTIGLNLSNTTLDFEDGELKTNKCDRTGKPLETMFITQTASIIDDLLATGGTVLAGIHLVEKLGATVVGVACLIELVDLKGREKLKGYNVYSLMEYKGE